MRSSACVICLSWHSDKNLTATFLQLLTQLYGLFTKKIDEKVSSYSKNGNSRVTSSSLSSSLKFFEVFVREMSMLDITGR